MRIQISDPSSTPQLILFLRNSGITAFRKQKEGELNVIGDSTDAVQAMLTTWNDYHEDATAKIVGQRVISPNPPSSEGGSPLKPAQLAVDRQGMQLYFGLFALVTAIWVAIDARRFDWTGNRIGNKTWQWIVGAFFLWGIVFPLYLFQRRRVPLKA